MQKPYLVCLDRDGTIVKDKDYYLGKDKNWMEQVEFEDKVAEGIKLLNEKKIPVFMISNQSGVALGYFQEEKIVEVNNYIKSKLALLGAKLEGCFSCLYPDTRWARRKESEGKKLDHSYIRDNDPDWKPNIGMVKKAVDAVGRTMDNLNIVVIGDRLSDVQTGLNAGGIGILISSQKTRELRDDEKVREIMEKNKNAYIANDFLDACEYVVNLQTRSHSL